MQPFLKLSLSIFLAHLLGDFSLQPTMTVEDKGWGGRAYLPHGFIHLVLLTASVALFAGLNWLTSLGFWVAALLYIALHLGIDWANERLPATRSRMGSAFVFVFDQALHLSTILMLAWFLTRPTWPIVKSQLSWSPLTGERVLEAAVVYVAVIFAGGYFIRYLTRGLAAEVERAGGSQEQIKNAGMYIGWLERFLVVTAILVQSPSMVGLILTGKSIARFPKLREHFAEYYLIGTLLSIGLAVIGGLILAKLWYGTILLK
jgi:hypothetical protein